MAHTPAPLQQLSQPLPMLLNTQEVTRAARMSDGRLMALVTGLERLRVVRLTQVVVEVVVIGKLRAWVQGGRHAGAAAHHVPLLPATHAALVQACRTGSVCAHARVAATHAAQHAQPALHTHAAHSTPTLPPCCAAPQALPFLRADAALWPDEEWVRAMHAAGLRGALQAAEARAAPPEGAEEPLRCAAVQI